MHIIDSTINNYNSMIDSVILCLQATQNMGALL